MEIRQVRRVKQVKWGREWGAEGAKFWMWTGLYIILCVSTSFFYSNSIDCLARFLSSVYNLTTALPPLVATFAYQDFLST